MATGRVCVVEGCGKRHQAGGWCKKHYDLLRDAPTCEHDGCNRKVEARRLCGLHYSRWRRHGDSGAGRARRGELLEWLVAHLDYSGTECLIWPFGKPGYSSLKLEGRLVGVHREMCRRAHGEPPSKHHDAAHSCGNGNCGCVNPRHLRWATKSENSLDAIKHGTHGGLKNKGEKHPIAKLTDAEVVEIRARLKCGERVTALAREYGVVSSAISHINTGKAWTHLLDGAA